MATRFLVDETDSSPQDFESGPKDRFDTLSYILFVYAEEQHSLDCQDILAKTKASVNTKIDKETVR